MERLTSRTRNSARFAAPEQRLLLAGGLAVELYVPRAEDQLHAHAHDIDCLNLVLEGSLHEELGTTLQTLPAGSLSVLPRGCVHAVGVGSRHARVLHVEFPEAWLARLPAGIHLGHTPRAWLDDQTRALAERCRQEFLQADACSSLSLETLATQALLLAVRQQHAGANRIPGWLQALAQRWRDEPGAPIQVAEVARSLGLSATALSRQFRRHFGMRLPDFVLAQRMDAACRLLLEGSLSLAHIASRLGFADQSHFCRSFQRALGMPPSTYRQRRDPLLATESIRYKTL